MRRKASTPGMPSIISSYSCHQ
ncbi:hypothetical protein SVAN01_02242 [Stagonosporopsis vannaccii]|nr:hypothetical protein SVAN01_02242 [Stagonosporopsis vannaccii]